jgi:very-short-patch-repair endonuclease
VIGLDGGRHNYDKNIIYDTTRTKFLNGCGYRVLRFWNSDIFENMEGVLETIYNEIV